MKNQSWIHRLSACFSLPHIENDDISLSTPKTHSETESLEIVEDDLKTIRQMEGVRIMEIIKGATSINLLNAKQR